MGEYEIVLKRSAIADLDGMQKYYATQIADAMKKHLKHEPTKVSKTRIKRLRGISNPDYRLRIGEYRAFYTVDEEASQVEVLRVMHKNETQSYYKEMKR